MTPSRPDELELAWGAAEDTQARLAVLHERQRRIDSDHKALRVTVDSIVKALHETSSDLKSIKTIGWLILVGVPAFVAVAGALLGGLLWVVNHAK